MVVVGDAGLEVVDDGSDVLEVGLHLGVVAAALVGLAGADEGGHGPEDPPLPTTLPQTQPLLVVVDKHEISQLLVVAPMSRLRVETRVSGLGNSCQWMLVAFLGLWLGIVLYFESVGVGDHVWGVNYIEEMYDRPME